MKVSEVPKVNMLAFRQYGNNERLPSPPLAKSKLRNKPFLLKEELMSHRYPILGPLDIENHKRYLDFSKEFFLKHFGKSDYYKVKMEDFELLCQLGQGTFGNVVLAKHIPSDIGYGIKIILKEKVIKMKSVQQTLQERNILQGLNNPFTIYLAYFCMDNSYIYFVLPYIEGGELFEYLNKFGRLEEPQAQFYTSQVVLGLEYLHHLDLVYRDLKPENILIDRTGYIKLVDFGFSKLLKKPRTYTLCGTPEYMAPEIILNKGHGQPADWWAMGVLVYELVSGITPFFHKDKMRIYENIVTNTYEIRGLGEALRDLIENLLQTDTTKRYGNLKGGVNDIKHHKWFRTINWLAILNRKVTPTFIPIPELSETRKKPVINLKVDSEDKFKYIFKDFDDNN